MYQSWKINTYYPYSIQHWGIKINLVFGFRSQFYIPSLNSRLTPTYVFSDDEGAKYSIKHQYALKVENKVDQHYSVFVPHRTPSHGPPVISTNRGTSQTICSMCNADWEMLN